MQIQTKALYNLIKFSAYQNPDFKAENWQIEDLKVLKENKLFKMLKDLGIFLDKEIFFQSASKVDTPEELIEVLITKKSSKIKDRAYLIIFELFKRYFSEKRCLSIFCDELDHYIFLYDTDQLENDEFLQDALAHLKSILDNNVDMGLGAKKSFKNLSKYLAHDLENFLIDYILDQIEAKNDLYAFELIDSFYSYVTKTIWFDFLTAKLNALSNVHQSNFLIENILEKLKRLPDLNLQFLMMEFMVDFGNRDLFLKIVKQTVKIIKKEKEFKKILKIVADFYMRLDHENFEKKMVNIIKKRAKINNDKILKEEDINDFIQYVS